MSDNNHFIKTDWVCLGKKWGDLPMYIKHGIQNHFKIPIAVCDQILPSETISIQKMLDFTLPSPASAIITNDPSSFFFTQCS
jgi:hypothetical protein